MTRVCREVGARPLFAYLPGPLTGQPELYEEEAREAFDTMGFSADELDLFRHLADEYLAFPHMNRTWAVWCWCPECDHEWPINVRLNVSLELVG